MVVHDFGGRVIKRYSTSVEDISQLVNIINQHGVEFHQVLRPKDNLAWIDIDPGPEVPFEVLKQVVKDLYKYIKGKAGFGSKIKLYYSGGRGFYIRIFFQKEKDVKKLREWLKQILGDYIRVSKFRKWLTLQPPGPSEIRLDISTYHELGSIRAPYSLNMETGLISIPINPSDIDNFHPSQADPGRANYLLLKSSEVSFSEKEASEIQKPSSFFLPPEGERDVIVVIQEHHALKAGLHWDLRLVDKVAGTAYSWVIPRARFPMKGEALLAIRVPNHSVNYSLTFEGTIPEGQYGAGTVQIVYKSKGKMKRESGKIVFETQKGDKFLLKHIYMKKWIIRRIN